jgi:hypothetical protein
METQPLAALQHLVSVPNINESYGHKKTRGYMKKFVGAAQPILSCLAEREVACRNAPDEVRD